MPAPGTYTFKRAQFTHKDAIYDLAAYQKPNDDRLYVIAELSGNPVVFTYPDGFKASIEYSVTPTTALDFQRAIGNSAVDELMGMAKADVTRMI